jgi:hypothetical protein
VGLQPRHGVVEPPHRGLVEGQDDGDLGGVEVPPVERLGDVDGEHVGGRPRGGRQPEVVLAEQGARQLAEDLTGLEAREHRSDGTDQLTGVAPGELGEHPLQAGELGRQLRATVTAEVAELAELVAGEVHHRVGGGPSDRVDQRPERGHRGVDPLLTRCDDRPPRVGRRREGGGVEPVLGELHRVPGARGLLRGRLPVVLGCDLEGHPGGERPVDRPLGTGGRSDGTEPAGEAAGAEHRRGLALQRLEPAGAGELLEGSADLGGELETTLAAETELLEERTELGRQLRTVLATAETELLEHGCQLGREVGSVLVVAVRRGQVGHVELRRSSVGRGSHTRRSAAVALRPPG